MSFAGSFLMIFFSMLTCTLGSRGGPNKMAAANFLWLYFLNTLFVEISEATPLSQSSLDFSLRTPQFRLSN